MKSTRCASLVLVLISVFVITSCRQTGTPTREEKAPTQPPAQTPAAQITGTPAGTVMTPEYVAAVGRFAYIWGWPLVNHFNRAASFAKAPDPAPLQPA